MNILRGYGAFCNENGPGPLERVHCISFTFVDQAIPNARGTLVGALVAVWVESFPEGVVKVIYVRAHKKDKMPEEIGESQEHCPLSCLGCGIGNQWSEHEVAEPWGKDRGCDCSG